MRVAGAAERSSKEAGVETTPWTAYVADDSAASVEVVEASLVKISTTSVPREELFERAIPGTQVREKRRREKKGEGRGGEGDELRRLLTWMSHLVVGSPPFSSSLLVPSQRSLRIIDLSLTNSNTFASQATPTSPSSSSLLLPHAQTARSADPSSFLPSCSELFWVSNPDPASLIPAARPESLQSRPLNGDLPVLVFLHAAGSNILGWSRQVSDPRLAGHFQFLLIDCPFHGFSRAEPRDTHTLEDSANCIVALLDNLGIPSFVLYGEGVHGVNVATWVAIKRKEKVQGLLLASPGWRNEEPSVQESLKEVGTAILVNKNGNGDGTGTLPDAAMEDILCYCVGASSRMADTRREMAAYFQERYGTGKPDFEIRFLFTFVWNRQPIPDDQLAILTCPVLILRGGDDNIVCPEKAVEEWQAAFVNAKGGASVHVISSAPAIMSLSDGNIVSRVMAQFFSKCTDAA